MPEANAGKTLANLDFHDGHAQELRIAADEAWLLFKDWQERLFTIHFSGVAFIQSGAIGYALGARIREFSPEKEAVLERMERPGAASTIAEQRKQLLHLEITNTDDMPTDIVFIDCEVIPATLSARP